MIVEKNMGTLLNILDQTIWNEIEEAVYRETKEETGLDIEIFPNTKKILVHLFSEKKLLMNLAKA